MTRLGNINLFIADVAATARFFADGLGLERDEQRSAPPGFVLLRSGITTLTLQAPTTPGAVVGQLASVELGFEADDLDARRAALTAAGAVVEPTQTMGWGTAFDAQGPGGVRVTVFRRATPDA